MTTTSRSALFAVLAACALWLAGCVGSPPSTISTPEPQPEVRRVPACIDGVAGMPAPLSADDPRGIASEERLLRFGEPRRVLSPQLASLNHTNASSPSWNTVRPLSMTLGALDTLHLEWNLTEISPPVADVQLGLELPAGLTYLDGPTCFRGNWTGRILVLEVDVRASREGMWRIGGTYGVGTDDSDWGWVEVNITAADQ